MFKIVRLFAAIVILSLLGVTYSYSQSCSLCIIDTNCTITPAEPLLCPDTLPTDTAQQYYEADVTFYIPETFDITDPVSATVTLNQIDVIGLTGLPAGMSWTSYDYTGNDTLSFYPPQSPPASERGCAKICGTPLMPGDYIITVSVKAYVEVGGNPYEQYPSFDVPLKIVPSTSGNSVFTMANAQGCDSITTSFAPILQSNGDPLITYSWDFGDSTTSTQEFPDHTYATPGDYVVSMTMNIYEYVLTDVTVSTTGCAWAGDVEELFCFNSPDLYFNFTDSSSAMQSITVDDSQNPSWSNIGQVISGYQFALEFWDEDLVSQYDYLGIDTINFTGAGVESVLTSEVIGNATIALQLDTSYSDTDTVHVYFPAVASPITVSPNDSVCQGDSVILTSGGGQFYQWYEDTTLLINEMDSFYVATQPGDYWVEVVSAYGCIDISDTLSVTIINNPAVPTFFQNGSILQTFSSSPNLQWHFNGDTVAGATGQTLIFNQTGSYFLTSTNAFGCVSSSDTLFLTFVNTAPVAIDDTSTTDSAIAIIIDVQLNDFDVDNHPLTTTITSGPNNGTAIVLNSDSIQYTPDVGFTGMDTIIYQVCDNGSPILCDSATVTILVPSAINSAPLAVDDNVTTDSAVTIIIDVQNNDFDPNYDSLTTTIALVPNDGIAILLNDDSIQYTPNIGFTGTDIIVYTVCDDGIPILCDNAGVYITVPSTGVVNAVLEINNKWNLLQNHPNPFVGITEILFTSNKEGAIVFTIYNGMGELVYSKNIFVNKGENAFEVTLHGMSAGIYMYSIQQGDLRITKRMVISK